MEIRNRIIHAELPHILVMYSAYVTVSFVNSQSALFPNHLLYRKLLKACVSSHVSMTKITTKRQLLNQLLNQLLIQYMVCVNSHVS